MLYLPIVFASKLIYMIVDAKLARDYTEVNMYLYAYSVHMHNTGLLFFFAVMREIECHAPSIRSHLHFYMNIRYRVKGVKND